MVEFFSVLGDIDASAVFDLLRGLAIDGAIFTDVTVAVEGTDDAEDDFGISVGLDALGGSCA